MVVLTSIRMKLPSRSELKESSIEMGWQGWTWSVVHVVNAVASISMAHPDRANAFEMMSGELNDYVKVNSPSRDKVSMRLCIAAEV